MTPEEAQVILSKPSREEVEELFRREGVDGFRVDIESDSTIRGDVARNQEQMGAFLQGTAQYLSAVGPLVQAGAMPADLAVEIFAGFARSFRLGKQAEDALDRLADESRKQQGQPKPPSEAELKMQLEQQRLEIDKQRIAMELQQKRDELALKTQEAKAKIEIEQARAEHEGKLRELTFEHDRDMAQSHARGHDD